MKKLPILFLGSIIVIAIVCYSLTAKKNTFVPYETILAKYLNSATYCTCEDPNFQTTIKVPGRFVKEEDSVAAAYSYARYAYYPAASYRDAKGQLILEYSATPFMNQAQWTGKIDSTTCQGDYIVYAKSVRRQKMVFTYSLAYPLAYDACVSRLKKEIKDWNPWGDDRPKPRKMLELYQEPVEPYYPGWTEGMAPIPIGEKSKTR